MVRFQGQVCFALLGYGHLWKTVCFWESHNKLHMDLCFFFHIFHDFQDFQSYLLTFRTSRVLVVQHLSGR